MSVEEPRRSEHSAEPTGASNGRSSPLHGAAHLLLALWAGSLWTVCGLVAPTLFAVLDRSAAGALVGRFFAASAWFGFAVGVLLIALTRSAVWRRHRRLTALFVVTAAAPVLSELVLGPLMHQARQLGAMGRFAVLHGISGALFLLACLGAATLVWQVSREA